MMNMKRLTLGGGGDTSHSTPKLQVRSRSIHDISIRQLKSRREARRVIHKKVVVPLPSNQNLTFGSLDENQMVRRCVLIQMVLLVVQTIAIFWNILAVWDPARRDVYCDNWHTRTSKAIITVTCIALMVVVIQIRRIDYAQIPLEKRSKSKMWSFMIFEAIFLLSHVPPVSGGIFSPEYDVWNILGTSKYYLIIEVFKINHPLWLRRHEASAARVEAKRPPQLIGSFFCFTALLSQLDPMVFFAWLMIVSLGMFTMWIYFMERTQANFDLMITVDYILSAFFSVPPSDLNALSTMTGRSIKILTGLFSMCYAAVVGWTFGFRVAENSQTVTDLLTDVNNYIRVRDTSARIIQVWWRERRSGKLEKQTFLNGKAALPKCWANPISILKKKAAMGSLGGRAELVQEINTIRDEIKTLKASNETLLKSNEKYTKSNEEVTHLLLAFLNDKDKNLKC